VCIYTPSDTYTDQLAVVYIYDTGGSVCIDTPVDRYKDQLTVVYI